MNFCQARASFGSIQNLKGALFIVRGGFVKIKKLVKINNVIKSVLNAFSVAFLCAAALMLLDKRGIFEISLPIFASSVGGALAVVLIISLLCYKKSEKKLALLVDDELNFNERLQTMVEFKNKSGEIVDIQREDTQARLNNVKKVKTAKKGLIVSIICFILAAAILASSVYVVAVVWSGIVEDAGEPEPDYQMSDYEKQLLQNLIEYVERSTAVEKEKKNIVATLKDLQSYLDGVVKESDKKNKVVSVILNVDEAVAEVNYLDNLIEVADDRGFTTVGRFGESLTLLRNSTKPNANMAEAFAAINLCLLPTRSEFVDINSFEKMGDFMNEVKAAMATIKNTDMLAADNQFILSLSAFCEDILTFCEGSKPEPTIVQEQFDIFFFGTPPYEESLAPVLELLTVKQLYNALCQENVNLEVGKYVISELMKIFNISEEMLPSDVTDMLDKKDDDEGYAPPEEEEDQIITNGGLGDGNLLFGGNDTIYYPEKEDYAHYGDAIALYQNKIIDMIESGLITDEALITYYENYFGVLFGSEKA